MTESEYTIVKDLIKSFIKPILAESISEIITELSIRRDKRYYTREEVCELIHIGTTTFYRMVKKGLINAHKIGNRTLVDADELDEAIETRLVYRYKHYRSTQVYYANAGATTTGW